MTTTTTWYEITYACTDGDWLSWRVECLDYHAAAKAAFDRLYLAESDHSAGNKLDGARLRSIQHIRG